MHGQVPPSTPSILHPAGVHTLHFNWQEACCTISTIMGGCTAIFAVTCTVRGVWRVTG